MSLFPNCHLLLACLSIAIYLRISLSDSEAERLNYCNRPWPSLSIYVPLNINEPAKITKRFYNQFLRSFLLFWPLKLSKTQLTVIIDEEVKDNKYVNEVRLKLKSLDARIPGGWQIVPTPVSEWYNNSGYDRQQFEMFYADQYCTTDYVGFADSDAVILTSVDREDLFEDNKPVVHGRAGISQYQGGILNLRMLGNSKFTKMKEPMSCMSYFPVIIKLEHLKDMRDYYAKVNGMSFERAFQKHFPKHHFSQFGVICSYLFHFKRDEYKWYIHGLGNWDGKNPPPFEGQEDDLSLYTDNMKLPKPRIATHASYRGSNVININQWTEKMNLLLQQGVCIGYPDPKNNYSVCEGGHPVKHGYYNELHIFEGFDGNLPEMNSIEQLKKQHVIRNQRIKKCSFEWDEAEMQRIMKPVNEMVEP